LQNLNQRKAWGEKMGGYLGSIGGKVKASYRKGEKAVIDAAPILDVNKWGGKIQGTWDSTFASPKFGGDAAFSADPYKAEQAASQATQRAIEEKQMIGGEYVKIPGRTIPGGFFGGGSFTMPGRTIKKGGQSFQQMLADQMTGKAPSVADAQMRAAFDRSIAAQQSATAGARGVNPALAQRLIAQQAGAQRAELGQQSGIARLQEQQQAQAGFAVELARQDAQTRFFEGQRSGNFQAMQQAQMELEKLKFGATTARRQQNVDILGKVVEAGATIAAGAA